MKKVLRNLLLVAGAAYGGHYLNKVLYVASGYAAKVLCSGIFGAGRTAQHIMKEDLNFFPYKLASFSIDFKNKAVRVSIGGLAKQEAVYRPGFGGVLINLEKTTLPDFKYRRPASSQLHEIQGNYWPQGNLIWKDYSKNRWHRQLRQHMNNWFDHPEGEKQQRTSGVVIVHKNQLIFEKYAQGYDSYTPLPGWSMTKSITNALVGILVKQGKLDIHEPTGLKEWQNDRRRHITLNNLLQMNSGLYWTEHYRGLSAVTKMLFLEPDIAGFSINRKAWRKPGKKWVYASGSSNIICEIIRRKFANDKRYWQFPYKALFHQINAYSFFMETDRSGTLVGSSYGFGTVRDWARFGMLYLNDGIWEGERILPEGWVNYTATPAEGSNGQYGAHFWLNASGENVPDAPRDTLIAQGYDGQRIFIIPSRDLVVVRTGYSKDRFDYNGFLKDVLNHIPVVEKEKEQDLILRT